DFAVSVDSPVEVLQLILVHLAEAELELQDLFGALAEFGLLSQDLGELAPALGLGKQAIQRPHSALVFGIDLEHAPIASHRLIDILELTLVDLRHPESELDELFG